MKKHNALAYQGSTAYIVGKEVLIDVSTQFKCSKRGGNQVISLLKNP